MTTETPGRRSYWDGRSAAYLGHYGDGGGACYWAVMAVGPDGDTWPWIRSAVRGEPGCACPRCAPHERLGPLPHRYTAQLAPVAPVARCGRPRTDGKPCRAWVATPGDACWWHRRR